MFIMRRETQLKGEISGKLCDGWAVTGDGAEGERRDEGMKQKRGKMEEGEESPCKLIKEIKKMPNKGERKG